MIDKSISVFLPALNEEENIRECISQIKKYLNHKFKEWEIIVVSSGSWDSTTKIVKEIAKKDKRIKSLDNKKVGYGIALRNGIENSTKELIFYTDADNQFKIADMDKLFPLLDTYDIVSAYRIKRKDPLMRVLIADIYNLLIKLLFGVNIKDIDASFKLYKRKVFENMKLKANTGLIDAEILIKAKKAGFSIGQIGVKHYPRIKGQTRFEMNKKNKIFALVPPKVIIEILWEIKKLWRELR